MADHYVRLQYSDDGGHTWTSWEEESIGDVGEYDVRPTFTRLGSTYTRIWKIRCTSPRRRDIFGAVGMIEITS